MLKRYEVKLRAQREHDALLLAEADEEKRAEILKRCFGSRVESVLAVDPEPMLILATDLLDKGEFLAGEQRWVFGWYKIWITTSQFLSEFAPKLRGGSMDRGHVVPWEWQAAVGSWVWVGLASRGNLDDPTGTPSGVIYVKPTYPEVRQAVKVAAAQGTLRREFPLSMRVELEADPDTLQVKKYLTPDDWGVDLVRHGGVKTARLRETVLLNDREGGGEMELHFDNVSAMLADKDVQAEIARQAEILAGQPERIKKVILAAPIEVLKEREDLKPYFGRATREEVLKSLKVEELKIALSSPELLGEAVKLSEEHQKKAKEYRDGRAKQILLSQELPADVVERTLVNHEFAPGDDAAVERVGRTVQVALGLGKGASQRAEDGKPPEGKTLTDEEITARRAMADA